MEPKELKAKLKPIRQKLKNSMKQLMTRSEPQLENKKSIIPISMTLIHSTESDADSSEVYKHFKSPPDNVILKKSTLTGKENETHHFLP